jgi:hypothetical protein
MGTYATIAHRENQCEFAVVGHGCRDLERPAFDGSKTCVAAGNSPGIRKGRRSASNARVQLAGRVYPGKGPRLDSARRVEETASVLPARVKHFETPGMRVY